MTGYKDITWCSDSGRCKHHHDCMRGVSEEVKAAAEKWWGNKDYPMVLASFWDTCEERLK